jgi:hypothetical protein
MGLLVNDAGPVTNAGCRGLRPSDAYYIAEHSAEDCQKTGFAVESAAGELFGRTAERPPQAGIAPRRLSLHASRALF